jgi:glycosyltransferase involved in cell wall biosynthesis
MMLTPDVGQLDRRIAQEAASLAAIGVTVDIYAAADPALDPGGPLAPGVRLVLSAPHVGRLGAGRRIGKYAKGQIRRFAPGLLGVAEAAQYRVMDPAGALARANQERLLELGPYGMVFAHDSPVLPLGVALKRAWGALLLCDFHEVFPEQPFLETQSVRAYWRAIERDNLGEVDGLICVNEAIRDHAVETYGFKAPTAVVHNSVPFVPAVSLRGPSVRDLYPIPSEARVLLFGGSLRPFNNLETMVRGIARARLDGWVLAVLGGGSLQAELEALVTAEGAQGRVFIGRRVAQPDLIPVMASAQAGVIPYAPIGLNLESATPNKLYEYSQARLPMAACTLPLIRRFVEEHQNGRLVDYSSPDSTARDIRRFVNTDLATISADALEATAREVCWEVDAARLIDLIDEAALFASRRAERAT